MKGTNKSAFGLRTGLLLVVALSAVACLCLRFGKSAPGVKALSHHRPAPMTRQPVFEKEGLPPSRVVAPSPAQTNREEVANRIAARFVKGFRNGGGLNLADFTDEELAAGLLDASLPLKVRKQLARELVRRTSDTAWAALVEIAKGGAVDARAIVAEALGYSSRAEAKDLLLALLGDEAVSVAQGAIRGFGLLGGDEAIHALSAVLAGADCDSTLRAAAALALGKMKSTEAAAALVASLHQTDDPEMQKTVLAALGRQPFSETERFFKAYLDDPDLEPALRSAALESVAGAEGDVALFLSGYIQDSDPQVRASAVWGLTMADPKAGTGEKLVGLLANEREAEVRTRVYQALAVQEDFDFASVMPAIESETDEKSRLAGFDLWAGQCDADAAAEVVSGFDRVAVPQLQQMALGGNGLGEELTAVIALRRAGTEAALDSLQQIARQASRPQVIQAAQSALAALSRRGTTGAK